MNASRSTTQRNRMSSMFKRSLSLVVCSAAIVLGSQAQAQFAKPEDAIKYRKNALFVMQQHFARLAAMAQGKAPYDAKLAAENAAIVANMAVLPWAAFG